MRATCLCAAIALAGAAAAQSVRWRLPVGGAVFWTADEQETCTSADAQKRPMALPHGALPHAPLLLANELSADAKATTIRLHDLRWLAPRIAFDLTTFGAGRTIDRVFDDVVPLLPLRLRGKAEGAQANGAQSLAFEIMPAPAAAVARERDRENGPARPMHFNGSVRGTLRLTRTVDAAAGVVTGFVADLSLRLERAHDGPPGSDYVLRQQWSGAEVRVRRQAGFEAAVAAAIRRGAAHVRHELAIPNRGLLQPRLDATHGEGYLALGLLTLLYAEVPANDAVVRQGFAELRRRSVRQTYSLALAAMAMERLHAPPREREQLLSGAIDRPAVRRLGGDDAVAMGAWTAALLANRDSEARPEYVTRWSYAGRGYDNSNTQYGVLGLHSAALCDQRIGRTTWFAIAAHWLAEQCPAEAAPASLVLQPIDGQAAAKKLPATSARTQAVRRAAPRGWDYHGGNGTPYGGMTTAGISSLTIALSHLQNSPGSVDPDLRRKIDQAILDGFAWLSKHRSVRHVPGNSLHHAMNWWFYYLYGLERACELSNVGLIDGLDWYHDHALILLAAQDEDGGFGRLEDTCWAILFLKKAQLPVFTLPR